MDRSSVEQSLLGLYNDHFFGPNTFRSVYKAFNESITQSKGHVKGVYQLDDDGDDDCEEKIMEEKNHKNSTKLAGAYEFALEQVEPLLFKRCRQKNASRRYRKKLKVENNYQLKHFDYENERNKDLQSLVCRLQKTLKQLVKTVFESTDLKGRKVMKEALITSRLELSAEYFDEFLSITKQQDTILNAIQFQRCDEEDLESLKNYQSKFINTIHEEDDDIEEANNFQELFSETFLPRMESYSGEAILRTSDVPSACSTDLNSKVFSSHGEVVESFDDLFKPPRVESIDALQQKKRRQADASKKSRDKKKEKDEEKKFLFHKEEEKNKKLGTRVAEFESVIEALAAVVVRQTSRNHHKALLQYLNEHQCDFTVLCAQTWITEEEEIPDNGFQELFSELQQ